MVEPVVVDTNSALAIITVGIPVTGVIHAPLPLRNVVGDAPFPLLKLLTETCTLDGRIVDKEGTPVLPVTSIALFAVGKPVTTLFVLEYNN